MVWDSTDNTGVGAPAGIDVIGQLFTPLGQPVGGEFLVNNQFSNNEATPDVAALPGGGFLTVYEADSGTFHDIFLTRRDADGSNPVTLSIAFDGAANAAPDHFSPHVAVSSATSALMVYRDTETGFIFGRIYNPQTNTAGSEITLFDFPDTNTDPSVAVPSNGNCVITCTGDNGGETFIDMWIVSASGSLLSGTAIAGTDLNGFNDREAEVTALTGGGFVVTWTNTDANATDILAQVFTGAGVAQGGQIVVSENSASDNAKDSVVVALADGGFIVIFDDNANADLCGLRYTASGAPIGAIVTIATGAAIAQPDAVLLADGRVAVSFHDASGEIRMEILDTRDAANATGVYSPQDWQIRTIGNDTITSDGNV